MYNMEIVIMENISIEILAEKLEGKLWIKEDKKRIYLDCGYNTKKMSTKTYVYQREDGTFGVSCYIDCPSQPYAWIKSQQEEVVKEVEERVEYIIAFESLPEQTKSITEVKVGYLDEVTGRGAHQLLLFGLSNFLSEKDKPEWMWLAEIEVFTKERYDYLKNRNPAQFKVIKFEDEKYISFGQSCFGLPLEIKVLETIKSNENAN